LQKYVSERLIKEVPKSLTNFLWYLWETYCEEKESRFTLQAEGDESRLNITICSIGKTITQDFGVNINATIVVRKNTDGCYMSYDD